MRLMAYQLIDLLQRSTDYLATRGIENARREVEWIFAEFLGLSRLDLYTRYDMMLETAEVDRLRVAIQERGQRRPLAYILGKQPFRQLNLRVNEAVLVPRPETEELIDHVLATVPQGGRIYDIGTGSGAIALACKQERSDCTVVASDLSAEALEIAKKNAIDHELTVEFCLGNLAGPFAEPADAVIANLPYIAETERDICDPELAHEPQMALFSGTDGLDAIRELFTDIRRILNPSACLWLEHGFSQAQAIETLAADAGFGVTCIQDGAGLDRFTKVVPK